MRGFSGVRAAFKAPQGAGWEAARVFRRCLIREDARLQRRRVWHASDEPVDGRRIHDGVDQDVRAGGELHEVLRQRRVAGNHDRTIGGVEAVGEGRHDRAVIHERCRDPELSSAMTAPPTARIRPRIP